MARPTVVVPESVHVRLHAAKRDRKMHPYCIEYASSHGECVVPPEEESSRPAGGRCQSHANHAVPRTVPVENGHQQGSGTTFVL